MALRIIPTPWTTGNGIRVIFEREPRPEIGRLYRATRYQNPPTTPDQDRLQSALLGARRGQTPASHP